MLLHYGINSVFIRMSHGHLKGFLFQLSVDFFFLLSGFVLTHSMRRGVPALRAFALKRALRLVPVHYVCLVAMLAIYAVSSGPIPYLANPLHFRVVMTDLILATPIIWQIDAVNVPSWSVSWELYLPLLAVAAAPLISQFVYRARFALLALLLVGMAWAAVAVASGGLWYGPRAFLGLSAGACLYAASPVLAVPARFTRPAVLYALIASMFAIMMASATLPWAALTFPIFAAASILVGARTRSLLSSKPAEWLGRISYTLYMVHVPVLAGIALVFGARINASVGLKVVAIALALLAAEALTRFVERPAMALGRQRRVQQLGDTSPAV